MQSRRNKKAAKKFFRKLLKGLTYVPRAVITDKLKSYGAAKREILPGLEHRLQGTDGHDQDPSQVPELLDQIDRDIERCIGDSVYDQEPFYTAVTDHSPGARVIIPPRKDAALSNQAATSPTQRDRHLLEIDRVGRFRWKRTSGYYDRSRT